MIKAEDLRIGDIVRVNCNCALAEGTIGTIVEISKGTNTNNKKEFVKLIPINSISNWGWGVLCDNIEGIPLTPKILKKNGWKLHKNHKRNSYDDVSWSSYHKPAETNINLRFYPEEKAFFLFLYAQEISETPIRYIHQFQHILWALDKNVNFKI